MMLTLATLAAWLLLGLLAASLWGAWAKERNTTQHNPKERVP